MAWDFKYADSVKYYLRPERELCKMTTDKVTNIPLFGFSSEIQNHEKRVNKEHEGSKDVLDGTGTMLPRTGKDIFKTRPETSSLMRVTTNSLADNRVANLLLLEYLLLTTEHILPDSFVIVNEDKSSTIIAYTLSCENCLEHLKGLGKSMISSTYDDNDTLNYSTYSSDNPFKPIIESVSESTTNNIQETLLRNESNHLAHKYCSGRTKFLCKVFFAEHFDALRCNCGIENSYILSFASCVEWASYAGKSGSEFLRTSDDRLFMELVSRNELNAFLVFAFVYFAICIKHSSMGYRPYGAIMFGYIPLDIKILLMIN